MVRPVSYSNQPSHSATSSITSTASSVGSILFLPRYMQVPDPSYISLEAANELVRPEAELSFTVKDVIITSAGLRTINLFLDYILHEILARAKATALFRLRKGVAQVIRTPLGTTAMVKADQELSEYLHDSETGLFAEGDNGDDNTQQDEAMWDLDKVWVRARIKCMIYSTMGDKEDDDFDEEFDDYVDEDAAIAKRELSNAGAIYLTTILEHIGEQCLMVAARAAYHRLGNSIHDVENLAEPVPLTVEDADVKRGIVEDDLMTRLWRKWKRSERMLSSISPASKQYTETRRPVDSRTGAETLNRLPFLQPHGGKDSDSTNPRRISIVSAPDAPLGDVSSGSEQNPRSHAQSTPSSPTRVSAARKHRHRHSRVHSETPSEKARQSESVINIKETLGERGVMLPDSPRSSKDGAIEGYGSPNMSPVVSSHRESTVSTESSTTDSQTISRERETLAVHTANDDGTEDQDDLDTPRALPPSSVDEDPLKTPTPHNVGHIFQEPTKTVSNEVEEDCYIIGGANGIDYSIWETKTPVDQRFYFSPPTPKEGSLRTEVSYEILPRPVESSRPTLTQIESNVDESPDHISESESNEPMSPVSVEAEPATPVEIPRVQVLQAASQALVIEVPPPVEPEMDDIPESLPEEDSSAFQELTSETDDIDGLSDYVHDRIADQIAEVEKDRAEAATSGLSLGDITSIGMSQITVTNLSRGPIVVNHTELTPILETSPRESMASDYAEPVVPLVPRTRSNASPTPTRHSSMSRKRPETPNSPAFSNNSADRTRTSSLTSQAERLRSKFLNRKPSPDRDLTVDTSASPDKVERRMKFENLIRSGETMKMTLTPTSLRSIEDDNNASEQRTIPERVRQQARENSTRELADFLRSTGPESFHGTQNYERRGSLPSVKRSPPQQAVRSVPSTPIMKNPKGKATPPVPSKFVPRSPVGNDPEHSTLQLAAFLRTTGPDDAPGPPPITLGNRGVPEKAAANSIHSTGDSSTTGLLKYQNPQSQRYPPSPSTSTAYGTVIEDDDDSDDYELQLYPGARRKHKILPKEESLADFLRNTSPPGSTLPPTPQTPKNLRDKFTGGVKKGRQNIKPLESPQTRGMDIFEATKSPGPRAMSPLPTIQTPIITKTRGPTGGTMSNSFGLNVNLPSTSLMSNEDYFGGRSEGSRAMSSRQSFRTDDPDEIQSIRKLPSRSTVNGASAREAVIGRSENTQSLADFLKTTGPTDFGGRAPKEVKKSKSGFFRRFLGGGGDKTSKAERRASVTGKFTPITIPASVGS